MSEIDSNCLFRKKFVLVMSNMYLISPVFFEVLHDVSTMLARELSMVVFDMSLECHQVTENTRAVLTGMFFGSVEVFLIFLFQYLFGIFQK